MNLTQRLFSPARASVAALALAAMAACGGGDGGKCGPTDPTCNPDHTAPTAQLTQPTAGSTIQGTATLTANAADDRAVAKVQFLYQGTIIGEDASAPYSLQWNSTAVADGTGQICAKAIDTSNNPSALSCADVTVHNTTPPPPPTASNISAIFNEADSTSKDLAASTTGDAARTYRVINVPADLQAIVQGNTLKVKGIDGDMNGSRSFLYIVQNPNGDADTAQVNVTVNPMTEFAYELREARTDSLITSPATLYFLRGAQLDSVQAVNGVFRGKVAPGSLTLKTIQNALTFKSDRIENPDGTLAGVNWPDNDGVSVSAANDYATPGKIIRLAHEGSPYGSLAEMMRIYQAVWAPDGTEVVPAFPVATIAILNGANAGLGYTRAPTAAEMAIMEQGALDTRAKFQTQGYQILIDTITAIPSPIPDGMQIVGIGQISGNGVATDTNGRIKYGLAYLLQGFDRLTVRDELYQMHAGQKNEDLQNGNTFYAKNRPNGITDLVPGDIDIEVNVNRMFARDAEKKRLQNNGGQYLLMQ